MSPQYADAVYRVETSSGITRRIPLVPPEMDLVKKYTPERSCPPWDVAGRTQMLVLTQALDAAGIASTWTLEYRELFVARGTGPGGRQRMGDKDLPGVYRLYVPTALRDKAVELLRAREDAIWRQLNLLRVDPAAPSPTPGGTSAFDPLCKLCLDTGKAAGTSFWMCPMCGRTDPDHPRNR